MEIRRVVIRGAGAAFAALPLLACARGGWHNYGGSEGTMLAWLLLIVAAYGCFRAYHWARGTHLYSRIERFVPSWGMLGSCLLLAYVALLVWLVAGWPLLRWLRSM